MTPPVQRSLLTKGILILAQGFGAGRSPWAPGTLGTLVAVPLYWLMASWSITVYLGALGIMTLAGIWLCGQAAGILNQSDPPSVVWDEIVGYLLTMLAAPPSGIWLAVGFVLFRIFDIIKPWPISWLDRRVQGGLGIMVDDLAAGLLAWGILQGMATEWFFTRISGLGIG